MWLAKSGCLFAIVAAHYRTERRERERQRRVRASPDQGRQTQSCHTMWLPQQRRATPFSLFKSGLRPSSVLTWLFWAMEWSGGCVQLVPWGHAACGCHTTPNLCTTLGLGNLASLLMHFAHAHHNRPTTATTTTTIHPPEAATNNNNDRRQRQRETKRTTKYEPRIFYAKSS